MEKYGVDLSHWNNIVNFDTLAQNTDFVILKAGGSDGKQSVNNGRYTDVKFEGYYNGLHGKTPLGAYYFIGKRTISREKGVADAKHFLSIIKGKKFEYPIVCDAESNSPNDKEGATQAVIGFCETLEKEGYYAMVYGSDVADFRDSLNYKKLMAFDIWVARYGHKPTYIKKYGIWQTTSKGKVAGVAGVVDKDISLKNYPAIIKKAKLNGYK